MEDVAVAYSFNKIPREVAPVQCVGSQQPLSRLTDLMRLEMAEAGFTEALTFALCSHDEAFKNMRRVDTGMQAVVISNPKTVEFQVCRTSLLPGLFKTFGSNKQNPLPWRLFEVSDTVHLDPSSDVGASNRRRLAAVYSDSHTSGFEIVHGLVERALQMLSLAPAEYGVRPGDDPTYLGGRCAEIFLTKSNTRVGSFGTVHPEVLEMFELEFPTSAVELDLEAFLQIGVEGFEQVLESPGCPLQLYWRSLIASLIRCSNRRTPPRWLRPRWWLRPRRPQLASLQPASSTSRRSRSRRRRR